VTSLGKVAAEKPDIIVPARGPAIGDPRAAIDRLLGRIRAAYANYLSIDALRWYFKDDHILAKARRVLGPEAKVDWMPMAETRPLPPWIAAISNSRLIIAADRSGFLVDCGGTGIIEELRKLKAAGKLASVEHVFITHYHDDHTDAVAALVAEFGAKVHACGRQVPVLERPGDFRLPCLTRNPIAVTCRHPDGDSWMWKEFKLTIREFPGQTLYHDALLVEREGHEPVLFAGDSFTPSGIDDYCLQNRNFLGEGAGYLLCLGIVEALPPGSWLVNQHVEPMFRFDAGRIERMRRTLRDRRPLLAALLPFDDPNFGLDEGWAVLHPYAVHLGGVRRRPWSCGSRTIPRRSGSSAPPSGRLMDSRRAAPARSGSPPGRGGDPLLPPDRRCVAGAPGRHGRRGLGRRRAPGVGRGPRGGEGMMRLLKYLFWVGGKEPPPPFPDPGVDPTGDRLSCIAGRSAGRRDAKYTGKSQVDGSNQRAASAASPASTHRRSR